MIRALLTTASTLAPGFSSHYMTPGDSIVRLASKACHKNKYEIKKIHDTTALTKLNLPHIAQRYASRNPILNAPNTMPITRIHLHRPPLSRRTSTSAGPATPLISCLNRRSRSQYLLRGPKAIEPRPESCVSHDAWIHNLSLAADIGGHSDVLAGWVDL
jgi:hypothetical protein